MALHVPGPWLSLPVPVAWQRPAAAALGAGTAAICLVHPQRGVPVRGSGGVFGRGHGQREPGGQVQGAVLLRGEWLPPECSLVIPVLLKVGVQLPTPFPAG